MDGLPSSYVPARIVRRQDHTESLATFWLRPERRIGFRPGQYVTLALPGEDGRWIKRPYSVLSTPHEDVLELFVECVDGGALTPCLFEQHEGDDVGVRGRAAGAFARDDERTHHVMACTVTGIAPFLSMLRDARQRGETGHRYLVLYGASHPDDLGPYASELAALAREADVTGVATVSRPWEAEGWTGETGRVEDVLRKHLDARGWDPREAAGYGCGNPAMLQNVLGVLRRAGFDADHLHEEAYFPDAGETAPAEAPPAAPPARRQGVPMTPPGGVVLKTTPRPPGA